VLAGGHLIVANSDGDVVFVSPTDGTSGYRLKGHAPITLSPIVANNTLYVIDQKGKITAYR
jgi:hypothetical protein